MDVKPVTLSEGDASIYLGMSRSFLRKARMRGQHGPGPVYVKLGYAVRYRIADLDAWLEASRRGGQHAHTRG
jgi:hypothetical protein